MKRVKLRLKTLIIILVLVGVSITSCGSKSKEEKSKKSTQTSKVTESKTGINLEVLPQDYVSPIKKSVGKLKHDVYIYIFVNKDKKEMDNVSISLIKDLRTILGDKIKYKVFEKGSKEAKKFNIKYYPTLVFLSYKKKDKGIYYIGAPLGHELTSVLNSIAVLGNYKTDLPDDIKKKIKDLDDEVEIKVLITPTCPYCPRAVSLAHKFAFENKKIKAYMIDVTQFRELGERYGVSSVPLIVYNEEIKDLGAIPPQRMFEDILKATD